MLDNPELPDYYKCLLFNELYFITDGGSIWTESTFGESNGAVEQEGEPTPLPLPTLPGPDVEQSGGGSSLDGRQEAVGQFLYLEGHEYYMFNI